MAGFQTTTQTAQAIYDRLTRQFGDESGVQITQSDVFHWINDGQREIATRNQSVKAKATTNLVSGTGDYPVPDDVLKVVSMLVNGLPVNYRSFQEAEEYILENDPARSATGQPIIWYEWGGSYSFWPIPDTNATGGIVIRYIQAPTIVDAFSDLLSVPDTEFNLLLQYCLAQAYEMDENWQGSQLKGSQFEAGILAQNDDNDNSSAKSYQRITVLADDM